jgi:hypothetical protein
LLIKYLVSSCTRMIFQRQQCSGDTTMLPDSVAGTAKAITTVN